jgi:hypothetical protein
MSSSPAPSPGQGRKLEGNPEKGPAKRAVLGVLPPTTLTDSSTPTPATAAPTAPSHSTEADTTYAAGKHTPPPLTSTDASKIPVPQEEEEENEETSSETKERELEIYTQHTKKNCMNKFFKQSRFQQFKKDTAEVPQAIANYVGAGLSTADKLKSFLEHNPNTAEVIKLIEAYFQALSVRMVKLVCKNIGDLLHALTARSVASRHSMNWLAAKQRLHQKEISRCQTVIMAPLYDARHRQRAGIGTTFAGSQNRFKRRRDPARTRESTATALMPADDQHYRPELLFAYNAPYIQGSLPQGLFFQALSRERINPTAT